jgi:hypothetical protein
MSPMPPERDPRGVRSYRYTDAAAIHTFVDEAASLNGGNAIVRADGSLWLASLLPAGDHVDLVLTPVSPEADESDGKAPEFVASEATG